MSISVNNIIVLTAIGFMMETVLTTWCFCLLLPFQKFDQWFDRSIDLKSTQLHMRFWIGV